MIDRFVDWLQDYLAAYLDDLIIFSTSWENHRKHPCEILQSLRQAGLTAKPSSASLACEPIPTYLGHDIVGNCVVKPEGSKLAAVDFFAVPRTKRQVRAFLWLTGYYNKFILNYAEIAATTTKKSASNSMTGSKNCNTAFEWLKSLLCSTPVLNSPNFTTLFVQTDASDVAVSVVLN